MQLKMSTIVVATMGISFGFGASASAGLVIGTSVHLTFDNRAPGRLIEVRLGSSDFETKAGIYNWENGLETFCIQLTDSIHEGQMVMYDVVAVPNIPNDESGLIGSARAALINDLYARHFDDFEADGWTSRKAAAFQIVLWEIRHETSSGTTAHDVWTSLNIHTGYAEFEGNSNVIGLAEDLLDELGGNSHDTFQSYDTLVGLVNGDAQNHITPGESPPPAVPGAIGLASGLGLLGLRRRRSRRV